MYFAIETTYDDKRMDITEHFNTYGEAAEYFHEKCSIAHCRIVAVVDLETNIFDLIST